MKILITNQIIIQNPNRKIIDFIKENLILDNPDYIQAEKLGRYSRGIPKKLELFTRNADTFYLPFGTLQDIWRLKDNDTSYKLDFSPFKPLEMLGSINLYDYQEQALNALKKGKNGILEAPCGSGKTQIGLALIKAIGGKALWLTHTHDLLEQSKKRCEAYFKGDFGTITQGKVNIGRDITFATVQTMCKIEPSLYENEFTTIIVDEAHRCIGTPTKVTMFYKILNNCKTRYKFGLSATLDRSDGLINCLFSLIGNKLYSIPRECVEDKIIKCDYKVIINDKKYDPFEYTFNATIDFNMLLTMLCEDNTRNELIIDNVMKNLDRDQLILSHRVKHVEILAKLLQERGIECSVVTGKIKNRNFTSKIIIATYSLAKEGLDIPRLDVLHLTTPQKDKTTTVQSVGRIERNIEGKKQPICFDYLDTDISYCLMCQKKRKNMIIKR